MKSLLFSVLIFGGISQAFAASSRCSELSAELNSMKNAQSQLLQTFVQRDGDFAQTLEQHEAKLEKTMAKAGALKKADLLVMLRSAAAFRSHQDKEQDLVNKFEKATEKLLTEVQTCLEHPALASVSEQK